MSIVISFFGSPFLAYVWLSVRSYGCTTPRITARVTKKPRCLQMHNRFQVHMPSVCTLALYYIVPHKLLFKLLYNLIRFYSAKMYQYDRMQLSAIPRFSIPLLTPHLQPFVYLIYPFLFIALGLLKHHFSPR